MVSQRLFNYLFFKNFTDVMYFQNHTVQMMLKSIIPPFFLQTSYTDKGEKVGALVENSSAFLFFCMLFIEWRLGM